MTYLFCYDITSPKRLRKTAKALEDFGIRIQKSIFQCEMKKEHQEQLTKRINSIINKRKDSFFIYPLCEDCSKRAIKDGNGKLIILENYQIL